jgi:hypothetical protein
MSIFKIAAAAIGLLALSGPTLNAQGNGDVRGLWQGTRSERNPITGRTYSLAFRIQFNNDGSYVYVARIGSAPILKLTGRYSVRPGRKAGDPTFTHILTLQPTSIDQQPGSEELRLLQFADLPNVEATEQFVQFYNLSPAGAMSLKNRAGGESWGLQRVP